MKLGKRILQLLFPEKCVLCGAVLPKNAMDLCRKCRTDGPEPAVSRKKLSFVDSWTAVWYYEGSVRKSLLRFKFGGRRSYAHSYGRFLAMRIRQEYPEGFDCLTWVPTGKWRRLKRGYDQVELLVQAVGRELEMKPVKLLEKIRSNRPQSGITGEAKRRANVLGAYRVTEAAQVRGKRILLLDDIITTGATVGECARVLLTAGGEEVICGAVAAARHNGKTSRG